MNSREMELFVLCVKYAKNYEDSNPGVGMGLSYRMMAENVAEQIYFKISGDDINLAVDLIMGEK